MQDPDPSLRQRNRKIRRAAIRAWHRLAGVPVARARVSAARPQRLVAESVRLAEHYVKFPVARSRYETLVPSQVPLGPRGYGSKLDPWQAHAAQTGTEVQSTCPPELRGQEPTWNSPETRALTARACFDCHRNRTQWPWYTSVAPVSWLAQLDVERGRRELNFSERECARGRRRKAHHIKRTRNLTQALQL